MTIKETSFFSYLDSRIEETGEMYGRFSLGPFHRGQALTVMNPLRRILLSEMPCLAIKSVKIKGAEHEFSILEGVHENVLDLLLQIKGLIFSINSNKNPFFQQEKREKKVVTMYINSQGPKTVRGHDIKLPEGIICINPDQYLATISIASKLQITFELALIDNRFSPNGFNLQNLVQLPSHDQLQEHDRQRSSQKIFTLKNHSRPIRRVNFIIEDLDPIRETESTILEIWTDGSLQPHQAITFAFQQLTYQFYTFTKLSQKNINTDLIL